MELPVETYLQYYGAQSGSGFGNINTFRGVRYHQRGSGLGSIFRTIYRFVSPIFAAPVVKTALKQASAAVGKRSMIAVGDIGRDILSGENVVRSIKRGAKSAVRDLYTSGLADLGVGGMEQEQGGSGIKRARDFVMLCKKVGPKNAAAILRTGGLGGAVKRRRRKRKAAAKGRKKRKGRKRKAPARKRRRKASGGVVTRKRKRRKATGRRKGRKVGTRRRRRKTGGVTKGSKKRGRRRRSKKPAAQLGGDYYGSGYADYDDAYGGACY
jgi:hypothetical protein